MKTTLAADIGFSTSVIEVTDPLGQEIDPTEPVYARIDEEYIRIRQGTGAQSWLVDRGALVTSRTSHTEGTEVDVIVPAPIDRSGLAPQPFGPAGGAAAITFAEVNANGDLVGTIAIPAGAVLRAIEVDQVVEFVAGTADLVIDVDGTDIDSTIDLTATTADIELDLAAARTAQLTGAATARTLTATVTIASKAGTAGRARVVASWDVATSTTAAA